MPPRQAQKKGSRGSSSKHNNAAAAVGAQLNGTKQQQPSSQQQQQRLPGAGGDDDMLSEVPPAFPQPVSSLPRDHIHLYPAAALPALGLPVSSPQGFGSLPHQQQPHQAWLASAAAQGGGPDAAAADASLASPHGVPPQYEYAGADGLPLPYDVAMAPYAPVYTGAIAAGGSYDAGLPLLSDSAAGFSGDMVFANRQMRHAFVRKVLGLVTLQLLLTAALALPILSHKPLRRFLFANPWVFALAAVATATLLLVLACSEHARRAHPTNLLLLAAFTACEGAMVGTASATYQTHVLLVGMFISAAVCLALIAYASQTATDFTASGGMLFAAAAVLVVVALAEHFLGFKTLHLLIGGCGALLFACYLVYDVTLLASGDSGYAVSADEYVFGAVNVYTDVVGVCLHIISVLSRIQGGDPAEDMQ